MKVIQKKINLEHYKSRTPSLIDCFDKNGNFIDLKYSSDDDFKILNCYPMGNYGMFPCDILYNERLSGATAYTKTISGDSANECGEMVFTYGTIKEMYLFFLEYLKLLKNGNDCENEITSATQYWEFFDRRIETEEYYRNLDAQYEKYGGDSACDYVVNEVFKTFVIPSELQSAWGTDKLYFIDVLKWDKWFEKQIEQYGELDDISGCSIYEEVCNQIKPIYDCCECSEYFNRGGKYMHELLHDFITDYNIETCSASTSIDIPLFISTTIDDLGEFSIFSEDWIGGVNYSSDTCNGFDEDSEYISGGGATVIYGDEVWVKKCNEGNGYEMTSCRTFNFKYSDWIEYYDDELDIYNKIKNSAYTYNIDGILVILTDDISANTLNVSTIKNYMTRDNGWILIDDELYPIFESEYITIDDEYLQVFNDFNRKYVVYKSKRYYSNDGKTINPTKIPFVNNGEEKNIEPSKKFIIYKNKLLKVEDETKIINGYFTIDNDIFYVNGNGVINTDFDYIKIDNLDLFLAESAETLVITNSSVNKKYFYIDAEKEIVRLFDPYTKYESSVITGFTTSKLDILKNKNFSCDDSGNPLNGYFNVTDKKYFSQPQENETLDLCYHIGNVSRISKEEDGFWGDLLESMVFYYENSNGEVTSEKYEVGEFNGGNTETIKKATESWLKNNVGDGELKGNYEPTDKLVCEFTYYLGAILQTKNYQYVYDKNGVKYVDKCYLNKKKCQYFLNRRKSYNIWYYELEYPTQKINYNGAIIELPLTKFEYKINDNFKENHLITPIYKEEYKIGISTKENIEDNIYIERPIVKPLERNLRLIDVMTLDSLEKYGNGSPFKIISS